jgi:hypothetical protein
MKRVSWYSEPNGSLTYAQRGAKYCDIKPFARVTSSGEVVKLSYNLGLKLYKRGFEILDSITLKKI